MIDDTINPLVWFGDRELIYTPIHFIVSNYPFTAESLEWVLNKLTGRFSIVHYTESPDNIGYISMTRHTLLGRPAFEDPTEAILYELRWA
jgi:hypothetical protein